MLCGCNKTRLATDTVPAPTPEEEFPAGGEIVLGNKLSNPFSVVNMGNALHAYLTGTKSSMIGSVTVHTTDYYVRFLPSSKEDLETLENLGLELIDHPLDAEIVQDGDWYHDPSLADDQITWQYTVVERNFQFPEGIPYEILEDCFLPENDTDGAGTKGSFINWSEVESEAYRQTGNGEMLDKGTLTKGDSNKPSGRIMIMDDALGKAVPVPGVRVTCNTFMRIGKAYTNEQGYYSISKSFNSKPRYRIVFKNKKGFGIGLNTILFPASYSGLGKHSPSGVSRTVTSKSNRNLFCRCVVNNAAYDYFNSCKEDGQSMAQPPANLRFWIFQTMEESSTLMIQQGVYVDNTFIGDFLGQYAGLFKKFMPDITIGARHKTDYASIYDTVIHECAHASHFKKVGKAWWETLIAYMVNAWIDSGELYGLGTEKNHGYCDVAEMWAYYVETKLHCDRYPEDKQVFGTSWWFSPQIFYYLDERGLTRFKICDALTKEVTDRESLEEELIRRYPDFGTTIQVAFNRYN